METLELVARIATYASTIGAAVAVIVSKVAEFERIKEGVKCLLRSEILRIYYRGRETKTIRQFEKQNANYLYAAYKALKGNSFVEDVKTDIDQWEMIS